jgi:hypothetical protein
VTQNIQPLAALNAILKNIERLKDAENAMVNLIVLLCYKNIEFAASATA